MSKNTPKVGSKRDTKRFRINQIRVNSVQCDSEPTKSTHFTNKEEWEDIVVSITDRDGSQFEVARITVSRDGSPNVGESTYVATLTCRRSWGTEGMEEDDDSVSCPVCLFQGHGAGACKGRR